MNLIRTFQISIYSLTAMSGAMLAFGEETPYPSGVTVFLAVLALYFNEHFRLVRLGILWCNGLGLAACGMAVYEFMGERADARLLAVAHFLVYLTWIFLFKDKQIRQYWAFFAMGLLQVAVGAVMTLSGWYGLFLVIYLILALWSMAVFHLYQRAMAFDGESRGALPSKAPAAAGSGNGPSPAGEPRPARATVGVRRTMVEDSVQQDQPGRWITPRFTFGVTGVSIAGLAMGLAMFLLVPRLWLDGGNPLAGRAHAADGTITGFSTTVSLGHLGQILESNDKVFELRLYEENSDKPLRIEEFTARHGSSEPLFRGIVLDTYEGARWSNRNADTRLTRMRPRRSVSGMIRQEYVLDPMGSRVVFCMRPIGLGLLTVPSDVLDLDPETFTVSTHIEFQERLRYRIYSAPATPAAEGLLADSEGRYPGQFRDLPGIDWRRNRSKTATTPYLELPAAGLEQLRKLARDWTAPDRLSGNESFSDERRRALAIESRLRDSGEFTYTLNMTVQDPNRDPIEDFLFNRKSGHCEYYASALAMMLRAVDIPSRLVTGYKGAERSLDGECYEVRQRHAHAWVEAYVDNEWIAMDATPGDRDASVRQFGSNGDFWRSAKHSLSEFWSMYIVSMSYDRQKKSLYDPLSGSVSGGYASFSEFLQAILEKYHELQDEVVPSGRISPKGLGMIAGFVAIVFVVVRLARRIRYRLRNRPKSASARSRWRMWWRGIITRWGAPILGPRIVVEFYEQFLALVSLRGLSPASHETQRKFARQVETSLAATLAVDGLTTLPREVTGLYCRVRFGGEALSSNEIDNLGDRMRRLATSLQLKDPQSAPAVG